MKNLQGIELKRGDQVIGPGDGETVVMGIIHEFYDRNNQLRVGGYPLRVDASATVLAADAYKALAEPLIAKNKAEAEAAAKAKAEAGK